MTIYDTVKNDPQARAYIKAGNDALKALGYTEHSLTHVCLTAETAGMILEKLGFPAEQIELARVAGFLHDIGNMMNRKFHAAAGAEMARTILERMGMGWEEIGTVCSAIGNHDEGSGGKPVSAVAAALNIADKVDVRRSRVQETCMENILTDIHDRVNYAVTRAELEVLPAMGGEAGENREKGVIRLCLDIDAGFTPVMDYFEIFLQRMLMCKRAAAFLHAEFELMINNAKII
ncbi:MAG: HD domain-containing protein [Defluviitaleaceae bacterium]|nr:HD domain-containing protein [Defluviitaleaceae bacterium]